MNKHIKHQIIQKDGVPLFVVVPYDEYIERFNEHLDSSDLYLPNEVVKGHVIDGKSLLCAWREYKGLSQATLASRMNISPSA